MAIQHKIYTVDDLWELSHEAGREKRLELVRGEIVEMAPTGGLHGIIAMEIGSLIRNHVRERQLGIVTAAETGFILSDDPRTVRAPDVGFIAKDRVPSPIPSKYFPMPPDLAVEVVSPSDKAVDIRGKVKDFLDAGTEQVWVIYPGTNSVDVHRPVEDGIHLQTLEANDTLRGSDMLPGFEITVGDIFPE